MWSLLVFLGVLFLAYLVSASAFIGLGIAVLLQWPKPHILCFTQPFSDAPQDLACFALHRIHFVFTAAWVGLVVLFSIRLRVALMAICCVMAVAHLMLAAVLRQKVIKSPLFTGYPMVPGEVDADAVAVGVPVQMPPSLPPAGSWPPSVPSMAVPSVATTALAVPSTGVPSMGVAVQAYPVAGRHPMLPTTPSIPLPEAQARVTEPQPSSAPP